jgi:hypothetical protein
MLFSSQRPVHYTWLGGDAGELAQALYFFQAVKMHLRHYGPQFFGGCVLEKSSAPPVPISASLFMDVRRSPFLLFLKVGR